MKRALFFSIVLLSVTAITAQTITIGKSYRAIEQKGFHPQFNTDGNLLAFTTESYIGLNVYTFSDKSVKKVTDDAGAGFQPIFSTNNDKVFYRNTVYENRLRKDGVQSFDLAKKTRVEMLTPQRNMKQPQSYENGFLVMADTKLIKSTFGKTKATVPNYVWSDGSNLNIYQNDKIKQLNPIDGANGYIWASLSPDGKMILFTAAGKGTFVSDLNGKIIAKLGYLNAAVWYDNNFVVGMQDKDDGKFITKSTILMKSIDGKTSKTLTATGKIAMYPTAAAGKVAYNTSEGEIHVMELEITQ
jgi:Tol biopolymer transport system component